MGGTIFPTVARVASYFVATAGKVISNTAAQTSALGVGAGTRTIPANSLQPGDIIRLWGAGYYSTPLLLAATAVIRVKVNGVVVSSVSTSSLLNNATDKPFEFTMRLACRSKGSTGKFIAQGNARYMTASNTVVFDGIDNPKDELTIDTTVDNTIDVSVSWDSASASKSITVTMATINVAKS